MKKRQEYLSLDKIVNHTSRKLILNLLEKGELNVTEIQKKINKSQPYTSLNLRILKDAKLVKSKTTGNQRIYSIK